MKAYTLKVELDEVDPPVWRRLRVPGSISMRGLHEVLQVTFGWAQYHLYKFEIDDTWIGLPDPEYDMSDVIDEEVSVEEMLPGEGETFEYEYDFGDCWTHLITVESVDEIDEDVTPECLGGENAAPPEDVGGGWGYQEFLEAIKDPKHPDHERWTNWIGGEWDEHEFDLELHNQVLEDIRWRNRTPD